MSRRSLVPVISAVLVCITASPATAGPPTQVDGAFQDEQAVVTASRTAGNAFFFDFTSTATLTGWSTSTAPATASFSCVQVDGGDFRCHGTQVFTGTWEGVGSGTTTNRLVFRCSVTTASCTGRSVVVSGTGDLADVHGVFDVESSLLDGSGTYSGHVVVP